MISMYEQNLTDLRDAYNRMAAEREKFELDGWKIVERQHFLSVLQKRLPQHEPMYLLEIGAGTGKDSQFFQDNGLKVICTDLSPAMVELCHAKELNAYLMDFFHLAFPDASFDAIYAMNCLLHAPKQDLPMVLQTLRRLLKPDGLFFMGVWGGGDFEGTLLTDNYIPKRFFSFYTDEHLLQVVSHAFEVVYFKPVAVPRETGRHFQSLILKA